jgi:N utilization substance protein B
MLNRRHLRVKVFQAIYSYLGGAKNDLGIGEKELLKGIDRVHELFVFHLSIFSELQRFAAKRLEERKGKRLPTPEDLNPNMSFVNNDLLTALAESEDLQKKIESYKISWALNDDIIKKLYKKIEESNTFGKYMAAENHDDEGQKQFVLKLYREFIADNEIFQDLFEETSIHWNDDHYFVCGYVVKFLKGFQAKNKENLAVPRLFKDKETEIPFH